MFYFRSLYFQQVLFCTAFTAGLGILPIAVLSIGIGFLVLGRALGHLGVKGVLAGGMTLLAVGLGPLARVPPPNNYLLAVLPASLIVAARLPAVFASRNNAVVPAGEQAQTTLASGL